MSDDFRNPNKVTILTLTPGQQTAWWWKRFGSGGCWEYVVTEKYGPWRVAKPGEEGTPCEAEVVILGG